MKIGKNNKNITTQPAPIPLERPDKKERDASEMFKVKLRTSPTVANSAMYEFSLPYFKGTNTVPEEWVEFRLGLARIIVGLGIQAPSGKFSMARQVLQGSALESFNKAATELGAETNANYELSLEAVTREVFPQRALQVQRRYMRRFMRKPRDMKIREYINRVVQINMWLDQFPGAGAGNGRMGEDELLDILEFAIPMAWQKEMAKQGFVPMDESITAFTEFCERLEFTEDNYQEVRSTKDSNNGTKSNAGSKNGDKRHDAKSHGKSAARGKNNNKRKSNEDELWCPLHEVNGHDLNSCKVMQAQAKKMRDAYKTGGRSQDSSTKSHENKRYEKKSLYAMLQESFKAEMAKQAKKKSADSDVDAENFNYERFMRNNDSDDEFSC